MKLSEAKDYLPYVQSLVDGKTIQFESKLGEGWQDLKEEHDFNHFVKEYKLRVKPTPKLRPWTASEVPVGAIWKDSYSSHSHAVYLILAVVDDHVSMCCSNLKSVSSYEISVLSTGKHSLDHGQTWKPCGTISE